MSGYTQCLMDILPVYAMYRHSTRFRGPEKYPVHIELECPWADGDVFITGNQDVITGWDPNGIRMNRTGDGPYAIDLNVQLPVEFKFTQGSWDTQIDPDNVYSGNLRIFSPDKGIKHYVAR